MALADVLNAESLVAVLDARLQENKVDEIYAAAKAYAGGAGISYPLGLIAEEIARVRKSLPASYDAVATILALARPIVEVAFIECGVLDPEARPFPYGGVPISPVSLMLIHLLAKVGTIRHYRQVCRELATHPSWLKALRLDKAPDHSTLYKFRKAKGPEFFTHFFHKLTALLVAFGLVNGDDAAIIDSAPVEARMNFARANVLPKLDLARLQEFYAAVDFTPALAVWEAGHDHGPRRGRKPKFEALAMIKYLAFEQLAGFLSGSKGPKYLKKHPEVAALLGFPAGKVLTDQNIYAFERRSPPLAELLAPVVGAISAFFGESPPPGNEEDGGPAAAGTHDPFFLTS